MEYDPLWNALFGDDEDAVRQLAATTRSQGYEMFSGNVFEITGSDGISRPMDIIAHIYPDTGPIRASLLRSKPACKDENWRDFSFSPLLCDGVPNKARIIRTVPHQNGATGEIVAQLSGLSLGAFTEPMFWGNCNEYQAGADCICSLSALAIELRRVPSRRTRAVNSFPNQLAANPVDKNDGGTTVTAKRVAQQKTLSMPTTTSTPTPTPSSRMRCRSIVSAADPYTYLGVNMYRLMVTMGLGDTHEPCWIHLHVSSKVLGGYRPVIGDEIEAEVAVQGHLLSLAPVDQCKPEDQAYYEEEAVEAFSYALNTGFIGRLAPMLTPTVYYESPELTVFQAGDADVIAYLHQSLDEMAAQGKTPFVEMGQHLSYDPPRPCALIAFDDPNKHTGYVLFEMAYGRIKNIIVRWHTAHNVAQMTRRLGRYPQ